jgi:hypothetical protein
MAPRLTNRMLEAIVYMSGLVEAGGLDECQGIEPESDREKVYEDTQRAGAWAAEQLAKREAKSAAR